MNERTLHFYRLKEFKKCNGITFANFGLQNIEVLKVEPKKLLYCDTDSILVKRKIKQTMLLIGKNYNKTIYIIKNYFTKNNYRYIIVI